MASTVTELMMRRMMGGVADFYADWSFGKALTDDGSLIDDDEYAVSDYLECPNVVKGKRANSSTKRVVCACFYNADKSFNKVFKTTSMNTGNMYGNSGYTYIRFQVKASDIDDCWLQQVYSPYAYIFKGKNV